MNVSCEVIKDLLPLYYDGACSEESKKLVDGHIADCESCREYLNELGEPEYTADTQDSAAGKKIIKRLKKKEKKKIIKTAVTVLVLALLIWGVRAVFIVKETPVEYYDGMLRVEMEQDGKQKGTLWVYPPECYQYGWSGCSADVMLDGKQVHAHFVYCSDTLWASLFPSRKPPTTDEKKRHGIGSVWKNDDDGTRHLESVEALFYLVPDGFDYTGLTSSMYPELYMKNAILVWQAEN